jgi:tRNA-binding protein
LRSATQQKDCSVEPEKAPKKNPDLNPDSSVNNLRTYKIDYIEFMTNFAVIQNCESTPQNRLYDFWLSLHNALRLGMDENNLTWAEFGRVEMRVGTIVGVDDFPQARKPAFQLTIDFGSGIGIRKSSAQITKHYNKEELLQRQIVAVVNFPKKQIGKFMSECLVLGAVEVDGGVVLLQPDLKVENGLRIA